MPAIANLGRLLNGTFVLAPLGWLIMSAVYFGKLLPFIGIRYTLTNRRVMVRHGWKGTPGQEVPLTEIMDVQMQAGSVDHYFRCGDLIITRAGSTPMLLRAVPDAESFRHAILDARNAWAPGKAKTLPFISAAATN